MTESEHTEVDALRQELKKRDMQIIELRAQAMRWEAIYRDVAEQCSQCRQVHKCQGGCGVKP